MILIQVWSWSCQFVGMIIIRDAVKDAALDPPVCNHFKNYIFFFVENKQICNSTDEIKPVVGYERVTFSK